MAFNHLNLQENILKAVYEAGYTEPTKIQQDAIPVIMGGSDIRASAKTGTGKTAAFLWPVLHRMSLSPNTKKGPRALILSPTRELANQIADQAKKYSKYLERVTTVCIGGGVPYDQQRKKLGRPYDILVATPGRLIDYIQQKKIDLSHVEVLILDEADRMLDMGFIDPVKQIASKTSSSRQTLLFSATLPKTVIQLSAALLKDPVEIAIHSELVKHENIQQTFHYVNDVHHKNKILDHILQKDDVHHAIVFTSTKRHADQLVGELQDKGHLSDALHGDMSQRQRNKSITQFRNGKIRVLVATDVAARGIDVQSVTHVINFDLPRNVEDYVHRIGRTGRAGAKGTALSFVSGRDIDVLERIKKFTGQPIDIATIPGLEPKGKIQSVKKETSSSRKPKRSFAPRGPSRSGPKGRSASGKPHRGDSDKPHSGSSDRPRSSANPWQKNRSKTTKTFAPRKKPHSR